MVSRSHVDELGAGRLDREELALEGWDWPVGSELQSRSR